MLKVVYKLRSQLRHLLLECLEFCSTLILARRWDLWYLVGRILKRILRIVWSYYRYWSSVEYQLSIFTRSYVNLWILRKLEGKGKELIWRLKELLSMIYWIFAKHFRIIIFKILVSSRHIILQVFGYHSVSSWKFSITLEMHLLYLVYFSLWISSWQKTI